MEKNLSLTRQTNFYLINYSSPSLGKTQVFKYICILILKEEKIIWLRSNIFNWDICFCNCQMITETSIRSFQCAFEWMCTAYSGYIFTSSVLLGITMMRREMLMCHRDKCLPCMSLFLLLQCNLHSHALTYTLTYTHIYGYYWCNTFLLFLPRQYYSVT